jgi:soluble lytic murein transglycosylase-like protein
MPKAAAVLAAVLFTFSAVTAAHPARAENATRVALYARVLRKINPHLQWWQSRDLASHVLLNSSRWRLDANLLVALVTAESRWHPSARSYAGAVGLGQLMPGTARTLRVNPRNADQNLSGCARYLSRLITHYENRRNRYVLAFAAYNAGPKAVARYNGVPPYSETQHYVVRVMRLWHHFKAVVHLPRRVPATSASGVAIVVPPADWYGPAPLPEPTATGSSTDSATPGSDQPPR